jgi:hypothetical protein
MSNLPEIWVSLSSDRKTFGLSLDPTGRNLPLLKYTPWELYEAIPMATNCLCRYVTDCSVALMRGYYLAPTHGPIILRQS